MDKFVKYLDLDGSNENFAQMTFMEKFNKCLVGFDSAIYYNCVDTVRALLDYGKNPNRLNKQGASSIHIGVICNNEEALIILIARGGDIDLPTLYQKKTPLHLAVDKNLFIIAKMLILYKCKLDSRDNSGNTALHLAVKNRNLDMVNLLLDNGASPLIQNHKNCIPLCYANLQKDHEHIMINNLTNATQQWRAKAENHNCHFTNLNICIGLFFIAIVAKVVFF